MTPGDATWVVAAFGVLAWLGSQPAKRVERPPRPDEPDDSEADK